VRADLRDVERQLGALQALQVCLQQTLGVILSDFLARHGRPAAPAQRLAAAKRRSKLQPHSAELVHEFNYQYAPACNQVLFFAH